MTNTFVREFKITGKRLKIGFDTNVIIFIIEQPKCKSYFNENISNLSKGADFYLYEFCVKEVINVLKRNYNYNEDQTKKELNKIISDYKINIIKFEDKHVSMGYGLINLCKEFGLHYPDNVILAGYKDNNMNIVYANDNNLLKSCRYIGIDGRKFPNVDSLINQELKKLFKWK